MTVDAKKRSDAAVKANVTRKANAAAKKRSEAAVKANVTRGEKGRSNAAKKAWETRRAN